MTAERQISVRSGWGMLPINLGLLIGGAVLCIVSAIGLESASRSRHFMDDFLFILPLIASVAAMVAGDRAPRAGTSRSSRTKREC